MSNVWVGVLGLVALLLWSGLVFALGRGIGPVRLVASDPAGEAGVAAWLAVALVGLGLTLLWGHRSDLLWVTVLPTMVAYAGLLFDAGRTRRRGDDSRPL